MPILESPQDRQAVMIEDKGSTSRTEFSRAPSKIRLLHVVLSVFLLFLNFFLAQYDKFVLSYFQTEINKSLGLTSSNYGVLSGYATGIVYALLAVPIAFVADYTEARVWVLSVATLWWSLCVIFQGLSHNFWQIFLARLAMGIGQAPVEALSISLISDLVRTEWMFLAESVLYVGVYIGEAVSGQIATAFSKTNTPWNTALLAIGIVGIILSFFLRVILREPARRYPFLAHDRHSQLETSIQQQSTKGETILAEGTDTGAAIPPSAQVSRTAKAKGQFTASLSYIVRSRSLWLLTLAAGARQFSGNVFGYYMPSYLSSLYPDRGNLLSEYGIIVGAVGSVAVVAGGVISSYSSRWTMAMPLYITAIGGMISSIFVILMVFSRDLAGGDQVAGTRILYGVMSAAYLTAELWLGAFASLLALLLPARTKTFGLAIYTSVIVLIYSSAPQIIGLALRYYDSASQAYIEKTKVILAVLIPVGYWIGGIGFLLSINKVRRDLAGDVVPVGRVSTLRKAAFGTFAAVLGSIVIALFVTSLVVS